MNIKIFMAAYTFTFHSIQIMASMHRHYPVKGKHLYLTFLPITLSYAFYWFEKNFFPYPCIIYSNFISHLFNIIVTEKTSAKDRNQKMVCWGWEWEGGMWHSCMLHWQAPIMNDNSVADQAHPHSNATPNHGSPCHKTTPPRLKASIANVLVPDRTEGCSIGTRGTNIMFHRLLWCRG